MREVELTLTQDHVGYLVLGYLLGSPQVTVQSTARASGLSTICIIVQTTSGKAAFELTGDSSVSANGCSAYSNSADPKGMSVKGKARLVTELSCSGGGYEGAPMNFRPVPLTDCPAISDPLAARGEVINGHIASLNCDHDKMKVNGKILNLFPGVYCGGLDITDGSTVRLMPGIFVVRDGKMKVQKGSTISGDGVGLVFDGKKATLELKNDFTVSLTAPEEGPMAGIVLYSPASTNKPREFKIESKKAAQLLGTVYLPSDGLTVGGDKDGDGLCDLDLEDPLAIIGPDCESEVGTASAWTVIIADTLSVTAGATLELNADYGSTEVPVPDGVGPSSASVYLTK